MIGSRFKLSVLSLSGERRECVGWSAERDLRWLEDDLKVLNMEPSIQMRRWKTALPPSSSDDELMVREDVELSKDEHGPVLCLSNFE